MKASWREKVSTALSSLASWVSIPCLIGALAWMLAVVMVDVRGVYISESNLKLPSTPSKLVSSDFLMPPHSLRHPDAIHPSCKLVAKSHWDCLVRGRLSSGGVQTLIVFDSRSDASWRIGGALLRRLQRRPHFLLDDIVFRFLTSDFGDDTSTSQNLSVDHQFEILVNVTSQAGNRVSFHQVPDSQQTICVSVNAEVGVLPNLDLVNFAVLTASNYHTTVRIDCDHFEDSLSHWLARTSAMLPLVDGLAVDRLLFAIRSAVATALPPPTALSPHSGSQRLLITSDASALLTNLHGPAATIESLLRALNALDERLHHSYPLYLYASDSGRSFVDFEMLQFTVYLVMASLGSLLWAMWVANFGKATFLLEVKNDLILGSCSILTPGLILTALRQCSDNVNTPTEVHIGLFLVAVAVRWVCAQLVAAGRTKNSGGASLVLWTTVHVCVLFAVHPVFSLIGSLAAASVLVANGVGCSTSRRLLAVSLYCLSSHFFLDVIQEGDQRRLLLQNVRRGYDAIWIFFAWVVVPSGVHVVVGLLPKMNCRSK